jgi:rhodanese-related sulfurtransferase
MKRTLVQLIVLVAVTLIAGTAYNFSNRDNPQKFVAWIQDRSVCETDVARPEEPSDPAPDVGSPSKRDPNAEVALDQESGPEQEPAPEPDAEITTDSSQAPVSPHPEIFRFVGIDEVLEHYQDGITLFIDARRTREYVEGHITGALSISVWEADMEQKISQLATNPEINPEAPIVAYCTKSDDCKDSQDLAKYLHNNGFLNLLVYHGGFPEWEKEHPEFVTRGSEPGEK